MQFRTAEQVRATQPVRARGLYERAARAGHPAAQASLGMLLFRDGNRTGALRWLKAAADQNEPRALLLYGTALFNGDGMAPDRARGHALVARAAAAGLAEARGTSEEMQLVMSEEELAASRRLVAQSAKPLEPRVAPAAEPEVPPAASGNWQIQLGAFRDPKGGPTLFARLAPRLPGKQASYRPLGSLTALLVGPYASQAEARAACRSLGPRQGCLPVEQKPASANPLRPGNALRP